jgi:hypothetical protein
MGKEVLDKGNMNLGTFQRKGEKDGWSLSAGVAVSK